jgi:prophage maintenance system killer protein
LENQVEAELLAIVTGSDVVEIAIEAILYVMKRQIFLDGNKRTAIIFANHHLIRNGKGLIVIPADAVPEYKKLLVHFYETNEKVEIISFLKNKCLTRV